MQITKQQGSILQQQAPLVALCMWQKAALPAEIAALMEPDDFRGQAGSTLIVYPRGTLPARRVLLVGMGEQTKATVDTIRQAGAQIARKAHELELSSFAVHLPTLPNVAPSQAASVLVEGAELGLYHYLEQKTSLTPEQRHQVEHMTLIVDRDSANLHPAIQRGSIIAQGIKRARDLANAPGNRMTPARLAAVAQEIGSSTALRTTVLEQAELEKQGFGGLLAVAQGSAQPPYFIIMEHGEKSPDYPTICLVGKGITFDTGGISIKPAANMDLMKMDMGGAAAVVGTMQAVDALQLPFHIVGLISAAENMPGAQAYKPGDVISTLSGKTVEVLNTDAEGRIVLADALFFAQRYQPDAIIDLATLTGAMNVALGPHAIGLMSNDQHLADRLIGAGHTSMERVWQLPLWDEYRDMLKSTIADIKNHAGRNAGAILAAAFLDAFVGEYPWAHLDIASTAWSDKPSRAYYTAGATGVGVRLLLHLLDDWERATSIEDMES